MCGQEVLESLRLHVRVSVVCKIVRDVCLPVDAVVLVEPGIAVLVLMVHELLDNTAGNNCRYARHLQSEPCINV